MKTIHSETQGEGHKLRTKAIKTAKTYNELPPRLVSFRLIERVNNEKKEKNNTYGESFDDAVSSAPKITENIFDWAIVHCATSIHDRFFLLVPAASGDERVKSETKKLQIT